MQGFHCRLEPLVAERHGGALWNAFAGSERDWTYLPYGPFETAEAFYEWLRSCERERDPLFFAITDAAGERASGLASYLRITPSSGVLEIGHLHFGVGLRRSAAATEALFLMMNQAFEWGYRRCEWKCDALNEPSRVSAHRLGFRFEGIFRQATIYKGRNRDTAWYAIVDADWPALQSAFRSWLAPGNFDDKGSQKTRLSEWTGARAD